MTTTAQVLTGTHVLVTAQRRSGDLALALARRGAEVDVAATLGVQAHIDEDALLARTRELVEQPADIVIITTGIGFRGWWETAEAAGMADDLLAALARSRLVARGPKAHGALRAIGLRPDWVAESETSSEISTFLRADGVAGARIAVQHHGSGDDGLEADLRGAGAAEVADLVVYRWGPPPDPDAVVRSVADTADGMYDAVAFTSAPGAEAWLASVREQDAQARVVELVRQGRLTVAAVGPVTAEPLRVAGLRPLVPDRGRLGALVRSLVVHLGSEHGGIPTAAGRLRLRARTATLDHRLLPVSPGGLSILRRLASDPGAVVSREDLLAALPRGSTDPHTAEVSVARLREAMGPRAPISTVVKRGYRLVLAEAGVRP